MINLSLNFNIFLILRLRKEELGFVSSVETQKHICPATLESKNPIRTVIVSRAYFLPVATPLDLQPWEPTRSWDRCSEESQLMFPAYCATCCRCASTRSRTELIVAAQYRETWAIINLLDTAALSAACLARVGLKLKKRQGEANIWPHIMKGHRVF